MNHVTKYVTKYLTLLCASVLITACASETDVEDVEEEPEEVGTSADAYAATCPDGWYRDAYCSAGNVHTRCRKKNTSLSIFTVMRERVYVCSGATRCIDYGRTASCVY